MACKYLNERKSHVSLPLNKKLGMTKLSEKGMSKAETGWTSDTSQPSSECKGDVLEGT